MQKIWGSTHSLALTDAVQVELIRVVPSGYCSVHCHENKDNAFMVLSGTLEVRVWSGIRADGCLIMDPNITYALNAESGAVLVPSSVPHQFINSTQEEVTAVEIYRASAGQVVEPDDIKRFSQGGIE